jgi:hypothetical protein
VEGPVLLRALAPASADGAQGLLDLVERRAHPAEASPGVPLPAGWLRLHDALGGVDPAALDLSLETAARWAPRVARFSFQTTA